MDVVIGLGEIGLPWFNLVSDVRSIVGIDKIAGRCRGEWRDEAVELLHVCFPYFEGFVAEVVDYVLEYKPEMLVIHSTVKPFTTRMIDGDERVSGEHLVLYSPVRGVHKRMMSDLKRYDKFYSSYQDDCKLYEELLSDMSINGYRATNPHTLEYAKIICDTSYLAYLIAYAMKTEELTMKYDMDYDEMWRFAHQIDEDLGNRPPCGSPGSNKLYPDPKGIRGHCVLPNLELVKSDFKEIYNLIQGINTACIERHKKDESST